MLRLKGCCCIIYLDDILVVGKTEKETREDAREVISLMGSLGFIINYKKSNLVPTNECKYLGFIYNSRDLTLELPQDKKQPIKIKFGKPEVDLFATNVNNKCKTFISWHKDPGALLTDAFTLDWSRVGYFYAFPPFSIIGKVLNKVIRDKAKGILVVPLWHTQYWYPIFEKLCVEEPFIIKPNKELLLSPFRTPHPLWKKLSLAVGKLSGGSFLRRGVPDEAIPVVNDSLIKIYITDILKTSSYGRQQPVLELRKFQEIPELCVASTLEFYLEKTKLLRRDENHLILTHKKPHKVASAQSISRWIKEVLKQSGVDTNVFSAHSTRHATSSTAYRKGFSIDQIKNTIGWTSGSSVFQKFYNRELNKEKINFIEITKK
ncbi:hypothetical protein NQ315_014746 [Exocentrus adspersus]|uniref:Reverse transcriptase domain-containing protein n=1 Tax=Exocentrus adspersus TaxID=1586481 RepID=A0AAV8VE16_9CUCU|nr:hypothetical protein NQ315_014746 [Exocentrus adspersus]